MGRKISELGYTNIGICREEAGKPIGNEAITPSSGEAILLARIHMQVDLMLSEGFLF